MASRCRCGWNCNTISTSTNSQTLIAAMSAIKESSDELNPPVAIPAGEIPRAKRKRTLGDYVALAIATVGVGYFPAAPGTLGSLVVVGLFLTILSAVDRLVTS